MSLAVRVSENTKMTSTFLHEDKNVPPDEALERDAPRVWLVRVDTKLSDGGTLTKSEYECSHCGAQAVQAASDSISPRSALDNIGRDLSALGHHEIMCDLERYPCSCGRRRDIKARL